MNTLRKAAWIAIMCGIVGLYLKSPSLFPQLGALFAPMLIAMQERGPDSAGFAVYRDQAPPGALKATLRRISPDVEWNEVVRDLKKRFECEIEPTIIADYAVLCVRAAEPELRAHLERHHGGVQVMGLGRSIEILKDVGTPSEIVERFDVESLAGSHIIGHTRMATESAVTTDGSHPFSTGLDLCLVHNGSLSNHNRLRLRLRRKGIEFRTDNDSEVAAGYLTWRLREGDTLEEALESAVRDLDGFYTFAVGTADGFAVLRDPIACKPAVMAETDDYVAIASEYRSLADLPGIAAARLWEPAPAKVYTWERQA